MPCRFSRRTVPSPSPAIALSKKTHGTTRRPTASSNRSLSIPTVETRSPSTRWARSVRSEATSRSGDCAASIRSTR